MFITVLGSSAKQTRLRECTSILVDNDASTILFDAGPGIVSALKKANRKSSSINKIILTHVHGDHSLGFAYLVFDRISELKALEDLKKEDYSLTVYGMSDTIELAQKTLELAYPGMKLLFDLNYVEIKGSSQMMIDDLTAYFIPARHTVPTLSTVFYSGEKKFVYTSDTLPNDALIQLAQNADFLIHEGMYTMTYYEKSRKSKHSTAADAAQFASKTNAKQLALVHIAPSMFGREAVLLKEVENYYSGNASIPSDGCVYLV